jgi:hypothetical protein
MPVSSIGRNIAVAGIVHDDIEATETIDDPGDRAESGVGIGHVQRRGQDAFASPSDEIGEHTGVTGGRDQIVARRDDRLAESTAETARTAGNKPSARHHSLLRTKNKPWRRAVSVTSPEASSSIGELRARVDRRFASHRFA